MRFVRSLRLRSAALFSADHGMTGNSMDYLADSEYATYGLEPDTPEPWVGAATSIINAHCNRCTLWFSQFTERIRLVPGRNVLQLTYLPLAIPTGGTTPLISGRARYGVPRRGDDLMMWELAMEFAMTFGLPGTWVDVDVTTFDFFPTQGRSPGYPIRWACTSTRWNWCTTPATPRFPIR
jgi:hypothetical protein